MNLIKNYLNDVVKYKFELKNKTKEKGNFKEEKNKIQIFFLLNFLFVVVYIHEK